MATQSDLFSYLAEQGFSRAKAGTIDEARFASWQVDDFWDFIEQLLPLIPTSISKAQGPLDFVTNSSLAGGNHPCAEIGCRLESARKLAEFAALYARRVLIPDPFELLLLRNVEDVNVLRREFAANIPIFLTLQPLIESEIIQFSRSSVAYCQYCYRNTIHEFHNVWQHKFDQLDRHLFERYITEVKFTAIDENGSIYVEVEGPADLVEHGGQYIHFFEVPDYVKRKARNKNTVFSKRNLIAHKDLIGFFTRVVIADIYRQNYYTNLYGHSSLTQRDVEFGVIKYLSSLDDETATPTSSLRASSKNISYTLPILPNIDIPTLVKLRMSEIEAFSVYQDALSEALQNVQSVGFDERKEIFRDVIEPSINQIEFEIRRADRQLKLSIGEDVIIAAGIVGIGLFSGVLPPNIGQILSAIGGFHYGREVLSKMRKLLSEPDVATASNFYFLWKARKASKRHGTKSVLGLM